MVQSGGDVLFLGPDPQPRRPRRVTVPEGACDTNAHIFGPHERYRLAASRSGPLPPEALLEDYLAMLDALGLARGVLVQPSAYGTDNTLLLDALRGAPQRLRGIAIVDYETVSDRTLAELRAAGVAGLRFNLRGSLAHSAGRTAPMRIETVLEMGPRLADHGLHAQLLMLIDQVADAPERLAELPVDVVVDHMGYPDPALGIETPGLRALLRWLETGRCWVKLSAPYRFSRKDIPYGDVTPVARSLAAAAPERMLWATDWPHSAAFLPDSVPARTMPNDGALLDILADWVPDAEGQRKILRDNPAVLYGFS